MFEYGYETITDYCFEVDDLIKYISYNGSEIVRKVPEALIGKHIRLWLGDGRKVYRKIKGLPTDFELVNGVDDVIQKGDYLIEIDWCDFEQLYVAYKAPDYSFGKRVRTWKWQNKSFVFRSRK